MSETAIEQFLAEQPEAWQPMMADLNRIILSADPSVTPVVEPMMGKRMIIYKDRGSMKYALAGMKDFMTLHVLPIYGSPALSEKYKALLPKAGFRKGCFNFTGPDQVPPEVARQLFEECAPIDLVKIREDYLKSRKK